MNSLFPMLSNSAALPEEIRRSRYGPNTENSLIASTAVDFENPSIESRSLGTVISSVIVSMKLPPFKPLLQVIAAVQVRLVGQPAKGPSLHGRISQFVSSWLAQVQFWPAHHGGRHGQRSLQHIGQSRAFLR